MSPESSSAPDPAVQSFAGLGKLEVGKLDDLVNTVWDHKDEVGAAVTFVREHGDELLAVVSRMPELLATAASALGEAAGDTRATAQFLTGDSGETGVRALADAAADALDVAQRELADIHQTLTAVASALSRVPLVGDALTKVSGGAAHLDEVGRQFSTIAQNLRGIGDAVDKAGSGLSRTADKLEGGAKALGSFTTS